jgi:SpoVK/Ycf46/Vps4 family AAA+-type ATPase
MLDAALWRRFDEVVYMGPPDAKRRKQLFSLYLRAEDLRGISLAALANTSQGLTPADISSVCKASAKRVLLTPGKKLTTAEIIRSIQMQKRRLRDTKEILRTGHRL